MKRLSIFDLQEGKIYNAFDGDRQLGKRYTVQNGQLKNASKDEDPNNLEVYENCVWVPLKASIGFEEVFQAPAPTSILGLKHGLIYKASAQIGGLVARRGNQLVMLDNNHKVTKPVDLAIVKLNTMFTAIGEISAKALTPKTRKTLKKLVTAKSKSKTASRSSARR